MPVVSARNLSKAYGSNTLLDGVSLTVRRGERVFLLGANGAGKSTLLRILAGVEVADEGTIDQRRDATVLYLPQEPVLDANATPRQIVEEGLFEWHTAVRRHEALTRAISAGDRGPDLLAEQAHLGETIEGLGGWTRDHLALEMLDHLGVRDIDRVVGTMSGGERRRVALARLLVASPTLAILDEPTNHLDTETIAWLEEYLAEKFAGAALVVTHDRYVLDAVADRVIELENGKLTEYDGGYAEFLEKKAELIEHAERVEKNRLNLLRRERAWMMRGAKARSTKQKARLGRAAALVEAKAQSEAPRASFAGLEAGASRTGKTILDLENVALAIGETTLVRSFTLRLVSGDRVGVIGPNGAGKTSLLRLVTGELAPSQGNVIRGINTRVAYFDQTRSVLRDDWSVFDNVAEREGAERTGAGVVRIGDTTMEMRTYLEQFLFEGSQQRRKVAALSGGERARVVLAKTLKEGANLLLLDEPTNDLDVATLGALEELLGTWPGCALVVSHDRWFLDRVATSLLVFEGDGAVVRYPGGYDTYRTLRAAAEAERAAKERKGANGRERDQKAVSVPTEKKPLTFAEKKELEHLLDDVAAAESREAELRQRLADPALYAKSADDVKRVRADHAAAESDVLRLTERWETLESRR